MERINKLSAQLSRNNTAAGASQGFGKIGVKGENDVVIVSALRTAIGRAKKGSFKNTTPDDLLKAVFEGVIKESGMNPNDLDDIVVGNVQLGGAYAGPARTAQFRSGIPETVALRSVNRQCSSGLQAVASIASEISSGIIDAGIGAGVESMTNGGKPGDPSNMPPLNLNEVFQNPLAGAALTPMGVTSENVAEKYGVTRAEQDELACSSHEKSLKAQAEGWFAKEIVPVTTIIEDAEGNEKEITVTQDDGPRKGTTIEGLAKLRAVFKKDGTTTAGNSSQVSDGAAAVILMRRSKAKALNLPIIGSFRGYKVEGCDPNVMGIGPAVAIPSVLEAAGTDINDVNVFEINEAFGSQAAYCIKKLGIPMSKVNPVGGAISLGHPLGCTGARQVATLLAHLDRTKQKLGCVSMCIGTGMGAAALIESE